jgi:hypothetical protein
VKVAGWLLCASLLSAQTVTVTGGVTNAITHEPIAGVHVLLFSITGSSGAQSDASGRIRIPDVKPGRYRLATFLSGFDGAAMDIRIEPGTDPPPFDLTMLPWPVVRGRVLDPDRHPVARVRVRAMKPANAPGLAYEATTDAAGRFAIERLDPGLYQFLATPPIAANDTGPMDLSPTWFPDVIVERDAPSVPVAAGDDLAGYDIILRAVPVFRVAGKVVDERGDPAGGATVQISLTERRATARENGTFDLERVRPGDRAVQADWRRGKEQLRGFAKVGVGHHDVEDITVRVAPPLAVLGEIELDGQPHRCEGDVILTPVDGEGERAFTEFKENAIRFESVYPGRYRLMVLPGWTLGRHYLDSVWLGERDLIRNDLDVVPGMLPFRVALRTGGGRLRGTVENGNGGTVALVPLDEQMRVRPFIVEASFDGGTFALDNVRPGDYYVFASQDRFHADEMQNPEYARPYLDGAASVRLERGGTVTLTLHYASRAGLPARAKLP